MSYKLMMGYLLNNAYNKTPETTENNRKLKATLLRMMSSLAEGTYAGITVNKWQGTRTPTGSGDPVVNTGYSSYSIIDDTSSGSSYDFELLTQKEELSNLAKIYAHFDSVKNLMDSGDAFNNTGTSIRVYYSSSGYSTINKDLFKSAYGDYVMFDYNFFNETIRTRSSHAYLGPYDASNNLIILSHALALRFIKDNANMNIPFINYISNTSSALRGGLNYINNSADCQYTQNQSSPFGPLSLSPFFSLLDMYTAVKNGVDPLSTDDYLMRGNLAYRCMDGGGNETFYIFRKDIIDEMISDLSSLTGYQIGYTGNIPSPVGPSGDAVITAPGQPDNIVENQAGTGDFSSDSIEEEQQAAAQAVGFSGTTYILNKPALDLVKAGMWSNDYLSLLQRLAGNPQGTIINCLLMPFNGLNLLTALTEVESIYLGTYEVPLTGTAAAYAVNTGTKCSVEIGPFSGYNKVMGGFLDDNGTTEAYIHLPFIGLKQVDPEVIYGHTVSIKYIIDLITGECQALIYSNMQVTEDGLSFTNTPTCCYEFSGQAGVPIGFAASNISDNMLNVGVNALRGAISGGAMGALMGAGMTALNQIGGTNAHMEGSTGSSIERQKSMDIYFMFIRPRTHIPNNYNKTKGRPSLVDKPLSALKGFTVIDNPIIETTATQTEKDMIINKLKEGVRIK